MHEPCFFCIGFGIGVGLVLSYAISFAVTVIFGLRELWTAAPTNNAEIDFDPGRFD